MKSIVLLLVLMVSSVVNAASVHSKEVAAHADITILIVTLDRFAADCGRYPTTTEGISALIHCPTNIPAERWHGPYFDQIPIDPWGNGYVYHFPGLHNTNGIDLYSCGLDGISRSGGNDDDDINNWDFFSPRGSLSDHLEIFTGRAIMLLLLFNLLFFVGLSVTAVFSRRVRDFNARHPTALSICGWVSLAGLLLFIISCLIPRIA